MLIDITKLQPGDKIKVSIDRGEPFIERLATIIGADPRASYRIMLALNAPFLAPGGGSHNQIWDLYSSSLGKKAEELGFSRTKDKNISWWFDSSTSIIEVVSNSLVEEPCLTCKRKNFRNETKCWWCGFHPFK